MKKEELLWLLGLFAWGIGMGIGIVIMEFIAHKLLIL